MKVLFRWVRTFAFGMKFHPNLYKITCSLETKDDKDSYRHEREVTFGMREVAQGKHHVLVNGNPIHLRGTVDNAVFPKTGLCLWTMLRGSACSVSLSNTA